MSGMCKLSNTTCWFGGEQCTSELRRHLREVPLLSLPETQCAGQTQRDQHIVLISSFKPSMRKVHPALLLCRSSCSTTRTRVRRKPAS